MPLREMLEETFPHFVPNMNMINMLFNYCCAYEVRDHHSEALNSPLLAVADMHFYDRDQLELFNIFQIDRDMFERVILQCPAIHKDWHVSSDTYNLFALWLMHKIHNSNIKGTVKDPIDPKINIPIRDLAKITLCKMLHYKLFTSLIKNSFKHGARADIMEYTIDQINGKFDIKNPATSTWRLAIEARCRDVIIDESIHYEAIQTFRLRSGSVHNDDIIYVLSDIQTRLRNKIVGIAQRYYENYELNKRIKSYANVENIDGEKVLRNLSGTFDIMVDGILNRVLTLEEFIKYDYIKFVTELSNNVTPSMLRQLLVTFSTYATQQFQKGEGTTVKGEGDALMLIGYQSLITHIVQKTYRDCAHNKVNLNSPLEIFEHIDDLYHSSRINDPDIKAIKRSVEQIVKDSKITSRDATIASLKIAFITYIIMLTFDYIK